MSFSHVLSKEYKDFHSGSSELSCTRITVPLASVQQTPVRDTPHTAIHPSGDTSQNYRLESVATVMCTLLFCD